MELKPGCKQTEVGVIPEEWVVSSVGEKGQVVAGKALAVNAPGKQRPYLRTKNVFDGRIDVEDVLSMPMTDEQFSQFRLRHGDVLLNEGQSLELVGRCSIYKEEYPEPCAIQNALLRFRANTGTSASFASHLFRHCQQTGVFAKIALQTTSVAHLGSSRFANLKLAWPTENEQRLIAAALDEIDALLGSLEAAITKKTSLKQAAMQELLTGKRRLPGFEGEWEVKRLGDIGEIKSGGTPSTSQRAFWDGGVPWCTPTDITALDGRKYLTTTARFISSSGLQASSAEIIPPQSLIMTTRATIGECAINTLPMTTNQGFKNMVPSPVVGIEFIYYLMSTQKQRLISLCGGSTFLEIGKKELSAYEIRLPLDRLEQDAISSTLSAIDDELQALEASLGKAENLKQGMMQQLLTGKIRLK